LHKKTKNIFSQLGEEAVGVSKSSGGTLSAKNHKNPAKKNGVRKYLVPDSVFMLSWGILFIGGPEGDDSDVCDDANHFGGRGTHRVVIRGAVVRGGHGRDGWPQPTDDDISPSPSHASVVGVREGSQSGKKATANERVGPNSGSGSCVVA